MEPVTVKIIYNESLLREKYSGNIGSPLSQRLLQIALYNITYKKHCSMSDDLLNLVDLPVTQHYGGFIEYPFVANAQIKLILKILPEEIGEILKGFNKKVYEAQYTTTTDITSRINIVFLAIKEAILAIRKISKDATHIEIKEYKSENLRDAQLTDSNIQYINFIHLTNTESKTEGLFWYHVPYVNAPVVEIYFKNLKHGKSIVNLFNTLTHLKNGRKFAFASSKINPMVHMPVFYLIIFMKKEFNFAYKPPGFKQVQHKLSNSTRIKPFDPESGYIILHLGHKRECILSSREHIPASIGLLTGLDFPHAQRLRSFSLHSRTSFNFCFGDNAVPLTTASQIVVRDYDKLHNYLDYMLLLSTSSRHIDISDGWGKYIKLLEHSKDFQNLEKTYKLISKIVKYNIDSALENRQEYSPMLKSLEIAFNGRDFISDWGKNTHRALANALLLPFLEYHKKVAPNQTKVGGNLYINNFKLFKRTKSFYKGFIPLLKFYRKHIISHLDGFVATQKTHQIVLVGVGSIGSYIYPMLLKLFKRLPSQQFQLFIFDNDSVETRNLGNQNFEDKDVGSFKVTAIRNKYKKDLKACKNVKEYAYTSNLDRAYLKDFNDALIISAVDSFFRTAFANMIGDNALIDIRCLGDTAKMVVIGAAKDTTSYKPYKRYADELAILKKQLAEHPIEKTPTHPMLTKKMADRCYEAILGNFVEDGSFNIIKRRESRCITTVINKETDITTHSELYTKF